MIALNMTGQATNFQVGSADHEVLLSTYLDAPSLWSGDEIHLRADEGLVVRWAG